MRKTVMFLLVTMASIGCATKLEQARTHIAQTWTISKVFTNGQDVTSSYLDVHVNYTLNFGSTGQFTEMFKPSVGENLVTNTGSWDFSDGINQVTMSDNNQTRVFKVNRLDEDHFNVTDLGSSNERQFEFVPN
ncbi:MAG: hypothetical protein K9J17_06275 [Flavobacteriales bacterium]|nr:hypothetical protein [Flavobacteriales bacterium]